MTELLLELMREGFIIQFKVSTFSSDSYSLILSRPDGRTLERLVPSIQVEQARFDVVKSTLETMKDVFWDNSGGI